MSNPQSAQTAGMNPICNDLEAETNSLVSILESLSNAEWDRPTPSPGWSVRDQVSHLTFFDYTGLLAATDADAFAASAKNLMTSGVGTEAGLAEGRAMAPTQVLDGFITARTKMTEAFRLLDPKARLPWYGPAMGALSFATARLMETWAHGQDVVDAVGASREPSDRLRQVAHIGVRARAFSYATNGLAMPDGAVAVRLISPTNELWTWNDEAASENLVSGSALDFCLAVTQRRHVADTGLVVHGALAEDWMPIAQAFAGEPGTGRAAGQFP
jgi:uncharacterized protein (TIGR03084 family)